MTGKLSRGGRFAHIWGKMLIFWVKIMMFWLYNISYFTKKISAYQEFGESLVIDEFKSISSLGH